MANVYAYIRVSTLKQGTQGVSLQEQRDAIERYAQQTKINIITWFEETETAAKRGRPIFSSMIKLLKAGRADGVVIHKIDRSARNLKDWADLGELIDGGIEVYFANEGLDLRSRGGRLSADIQAVVAADFIRNLKEETRKGFYGRLKQGLYPLPAPLGYLDKGKGNPKEPDPATAPLVKKAFELYAGGELNYLILTKELYRLGLRNRNGGKVTKNGISTMLNNPFYIGLIRLRSTGELFPGVHQPIVSKTVFDHVQVVLHGKTNTRTRRHSFLFRRLLKCKGCGYSLIGEIQKGIIYYRCHTKRCITTCVRQDSVERSIQARITKVQFNKAETKELGKRIAVLRTKWAQEKMFVMKCLRLTLKRIQDRIDRLTDAYIDRLIDKELFERRKAALLMEQKDIEEKIAEVENGSYSVPERMAKFLERAKSLYVSYELGIPEEKRGLLKSVTSNRTVEGKNVEIALRTPYLEVANRAVSVNCDPSQDTTRICNGKLASVGKLFHNLLEYFSREVANEKNNTEHSFTKNVF